MAKGHTKVTPQRVRETEWPAPGWMGTGSAALRLRQDAGRYPQGGGGYKVLD